MSRFALNEITKEHQIIISWGYSSLEGKALVGKLGL